MKPPVAEIKPTKLTHLGDSRIDNYFWLNQRSNPKVINYIKAENRYCKSILKPVEKLQDSIFKEMKSRMREVESSAPYLKNGYWYYERYEKGKEHPIECRKKGSLKAKEEILVDCNKHARGKSYYELVAFSITRDNKWMAFVEDFQGRRLYTVRFKNLETGKISDEKIQNAGSDLAWHHDNKTLYYTAKDPVTLRPGEIKKYTLGQKKSSSVYVEKDETFICGTSLSKDEQFIFIGSYSSTTTEFRYKSAGGSDKFNVFLPRKKGHEYYPDSAGDHFVIKTNLSAPNFKLIRCDLQKRTPKFWSPIQAHDEKVLIEDFECFEKFIVTQEKKSGLTRLRVIRNSTGKHRFIPPIEETFTLYLGTNPEFTSESVRIGYSSLTSPHTTYDINLKSLQKTVAGQTKVLGGFNQKDYKSKRIWAISHDGTKIPVSLVYHRDHFSKSGKNPLLLYGYGAYGATIDPYFSSARLSLLNRGFVFAIAHIRGGEDLGRSWYDQGKMLHKKNSFLDFIACGEFLVKSKYAAKDKLFAMGGSAGGLLMGAIANMRPGLWRGIIASVPFMDVVTTMLDSSIPLTTGEYDEWGNPAIKRYYQYMKSYSPYDNIQAVNYPAMLITSGLHDSQVQYWEPTKYVAKLRSLKTDNNPVLLHTNMNSGHGGDSGRFEQLREIAMEYAFLLLILRKSS